MVTRLRSIPAGIAGWSLAALLALGGCANNAGDGPPEFEADSGSGDNQSGIRISLQPEVLALFPGEEHTLTVQVKPEDVYEVRLALLGDSRDAFLDSGSVRTDSSGKAEVVVTAPAEAASFSLRASVEDAEATATIAVSTKGFANIIVTPAYEGKRHVEEWVASARTGTSCDELEGPPTDGVHISHAAFGKEPVLRSVPVGPRLTVTVRAGYFASGCKDVDDILAGDEHAVTIQVVDRPLQLTQTDLELDMRLDRSPEFDEALRKVRLDYFAAWHGLDPTDGATGDFNDIARLLDVMATELDNDVQLVAYDSARERDGWDSALLRTFGGARPVLDRLTLWSELGISSLYGESGLFGRLSPASEDGQDATLQLESVAGLERARAGFPGEVLASLTPEPEDNLRVGANLPWLPTRLLVALMERAAQEETQEKSVASALAADLTCRDVAQALVGANNAQPTVAFADCGQECMEQLCQKALASLTELAAAASDLPAHLELSGVGQVTITEDAAPEVWEGVWVGVASFIDDGVAATGGAFRGQPPPP